MESLGVLAGGIAHDFNNLLTGVLGNASLARLIVLRQLSAFGASNAGTGAATGIGHAPVAVPVQVLPQAGQSPHAQVLHYLGQIETVAQRAADLCRQMLAYAGKSHVTLERIDLSHLVRQTLPLLQMSAQTAPVRLQLGADLPPVLADATQLRQVVMNLVINASEAISDKYTRPDRDRDRDRDPLASREHGTDEITISTMVLDIDRDFLRTAFASPEIAPGPFVALQVTDTGIGMSPETMQRIFDPFFSTKFTGRGLGLPVVLGIVRGHRGALKVHSCLGEGSTFLLLFPRVDGLPQRATPPSMPTVSVDGGGTVLVVDDDTSVRTVVARLLETVGFHVVTAPDGAEALDLFKRYESSIRLVLLDLTMPRLSGDRVLARIQRIRRDVPVVLMSGHSAEEIATRFGQSVAGYLQKPFRVEAVLKLVSQLAPMGRPAAP